MNVFDQEKWIENLKYAGIIQRSVLPQSKNIEQIASEHAVIYDPLEYVSGDFFWTANKEPFQYLAVGDCTGHGVPAAMLSLFVLNQLEYLIMNKMLINTSEILREIDKRFIESFHGQKDYLYNTEWIDISLVCINRMKNELYFSGANRKILIVKSNGEAQVLKGNNFPIGGWQFSENREFSVQIATFEKGDLLYLGSDGFQNQLGGEKTKKFGSNRLHEFFQKNASLHLSEQFSLLKEEFERWKGSHEQTDDICLLGVRL
ncbi:MAG: SpoIIE family protein phosphatase [Cryomorphaceae bacterium]|jgi:serine phosphatase RsbU (regulator of sigma subunit)|nr:SpoIIE family protein phosphatase [Cryomorphaceae bacterium]